MNNRLNRRGVMALGLRTLLTCALIVSSLSVSSRQVEGATARGTTYVGLDSIQSAPLQPVTTGQLHDDQSRKTNLHKGHHRSSEEVQTLFVAPGVSGFAPRVASSVSLEPHSAPLLTTDFSQTSPRAPPSFSF